MTRIPKAAPLARLGGTVRRVFTPGPLWLPISMLALPALAWLALEGRAYPPFEPYQTGDYANIELYTRLAAEGSQRVGPQSRFHIHHPGPVFFYAAAPVYALFGGTTKGMAAAALAWNVVWLVLMVRSVARLAPRTGPLVAALLLAVFIAGRGLGWFLSSWNPHVAMLPFATALFASARLASGEGRALPLLVLAASAVVQCHLVWALPVALMGAAGLLLCVLPSLRRGLRVPSAGGGLSRASLGGAVLVASVMWVLPVADEITGTYGNLHRILELGTHGSPTRTWGEAMIPAARGLRLESGSLVRAASLVLEWGDPDPAPPDAEAPLPSSMAAGDVLWSLLVVGGLVSAVGLASRRGSRTTALGPIAALGLVSGPLVALLSPGRELPPYMFQWEAMVALAVLLMVGVEVLARTPRSSALAAGPAAKALVLLVPAVLIVLSIRQQAAAGPAPRNGRSVEVERLTREVAARVAADAPGRRFLVRIAPHEDQAMVGGLILALDKAGVRFGVVPSGSWRIEGRFTPRGDERAELLIGSLPALPGAERLGSPDGPTVVWQTPWRAGHAALAGRGERRGLEPSDPPVRPAP